MAGLNYDVDSGIENTDIVDGTAVKEPSIAQNLDKTATITASTNEIRVDPKDTPTPQELEALSNMDLNFKLVNDTQTKIVNMKDVEDEIIGGPGIDQEGAQFAATAFEGLLDGPVSLKQYTQFKSKVSMEHTRRYMRTCIAKESANASLIFKSFVDQSMEDAKNLLSQLEMNYLPRIRGTVASISSYSSGVSEALKSNQNVIFPYGGDFVNLVSQDLLTIEWSKVENLKADTVRLERYTEALKAMMKTAGGAYLYAVLDGRGFDAIGQDEVRMAALVMPLTIQDILAFYASPMAADLLYDAQSKASEALTTIDNFQYEAKNQIEEGKINWEKGNVLDASVAGVVGDITRLLEIVTQLAVFNFVSSELIEVYKAM